MSNIGGLTNLTYDKCFYEQDNKQRTGPFAYQMFYGKFENDNKCRENKIIRPFDLVNEESELKNITRGASKCSSMKYNPGCSKGCKCNCANTCKMPTVLAPEVCPIVSSGIKKPSGINYGLPKGSCCCDK